MSFQISSLSTDIPGIVMRARLLHGEWTRAWNLLPPETTQNVELNVTTDDYKRAEITIVDEMGRTALLVFASLADGSFGIKGNIVGWEKVLQTREGKVRSLFGPGRKVGLHLRENGCVEVRAVEKVTWLLGGKETTEVMLELPAFRAAYGSRPPAYEKS